MGAAGMMMGMGVAQGAMGYMQGQSEADAAEGMAQQARDGIGYEQQVKRSNIALNEGNRIISVEQQEYANNQALGSAQAAMGASGTQLSGTSLEVLAEQMSLNVNAVQAVNAKAGEARSQFINSGNLAINKLQRQEVEFMNQASQARNAAVMAALSGVGQGILGAYTVDPSFFSSGTPASALGTGGFTNNDFVSEGGFGGAPANLFGNK